MPEITIACVRTDEYHNGEITEGKLRINIAVKQRKNISAAGIEFIRRVGDYLFIRSHTCVLTNHYYNDVALDLKTGKLSYIEYRGCVASPSVLIGGDVPKTMEFLEYYNEILLRGFDDKKYRISCVSFGNAKCQLVGNFVKYNDETFLYIAGDAANIVQLYKPKGVFIPHDCNCNFVNICASRFYRYMNGDTVYIIQLVAVEALKIVEITHPAETANFAELCAKSAVPRYANSTAILAKRRANRYALKINVPGVINPFWRTATGDVRRLRYQLIKLFVRDFHLPLDIVKIIVTLCKV